MKNLKLFGVHIEIKLTIVDFYVITACLKQEDVQFGLEN